jgi:hypothetical protein
MKERAKLPPAAEQAWRKANHVHGRDPREIRQDPHGHLMRKSAYAKKRGFGRWRLLGGVAHACPNGRAGGR